MKIGGRTGHVACAFDDYIAGKMDAALLHALIAVDGTAKRHLRLERVRERYTRFLREYSWIVEPMMGQGINWIDTLFPNINLQKRSGKAADYADVIYEIFRCSHAHGDEIPPQYSLTPSCEGKPGVQFAKNEVHLPETVLWGLLAAVVFAKVNKNQETVGDFWFTLGGQVYPVDLWWGREDEFRAIAEANNPVRIKIDGLDKWASDTDTTQSVATCVSILPIAPSKKEEECKAQITTVISPVGEGKV